MRFLPGARAAAVSAALGISLAATAAVVFRDDLQVPYYLWQLDSKDEPDRLRAAERLGEVRSTRAVPRLVSLLRAERYGAPQAEVYGAALEGIGAPAVPALLEAMPRKGASRPDAVPVVLQRIAQRAIPQVGQALEHHDPVVRRSAAGVLGTMDPPEAGAVPFLLQALEDSDRLVSWEAASHLKRFDLPVDAIMPLARILRRTDQEFDFRLQVTLALAKTGEAAFPFLVDAIEDPSAEVRAAAAGSLGHLSAPFREQALPVLVKAFRELGHEAQHGKPAVRLWATRFLGALNPPDPRAEPFLLHALADDSEEVRSGAAFSIDRFALGPEAVEPLRRALTRPDQEIVSREHCAAALAKLGEIAFPVLAEAARDPAAADVRRAAVRSLRHLPPPLRESALPILLGALKDADHHVRSCAAESLGKFERDAAGALPDLVKLLEDERAAVLSAVLMALQKIGPPEAALPGLIRILSRGGEAQYVRDYAISVLGDMGARALPAAGALNAALQDPNWEVRRLAAAALRQIGAGEKKETP